MLPAFANEPGSLNSRSGFYASAGGLYAVEDFDSSSRLNFDNAPGFNLRLGYRIHPHFAVEAMGERADAFNNHLSSIELARFGAPGDASDFKIRNEVNTWAGRVNGKVFASTGRFQPYLLAGVGFVQAEFQTKASVTGREAASGKFNRFGLAFRYGAGLDAYLTENWVAFLEYSYVHSISFLIIQDNILLVLRIHGKFVLAHIHRIFGHFQIIEHHSYIHRQRSHCLRDAL